MRTNLIMCKNYLNKIKKIFNDFFIDRINTATTTLWPLRFYSFNKTKHCSTSALTVISRYKILKKNLYYCFRPNGSNSRELFCPAKDCNPGEEPKMSQAEKDSEFGNATTMPVTNGHHPPYQSHHHHLSLQELRALQVFH